MNDAPPLLASSLPSLVGGSEKQIEWACDIRFDAHMAALPEMMSLIRQREQASDKREIALLDSLLAAYTWFWESHVYAGWWISNRKGNHHERVRLVTKEIESHLSGPALGARAEIDLFYIEGSGWKARPRRRRN